MYLCVRGTKTVKCTVMHLCVRGTTVHFTGFVSLTQMHDCTLYWLGTPNTQIHDGTLYWLGTPNTQIQDC
jgi:hypothetical protein